MFCHTSIISSSSSTPLIPPPMLHPVWSRRRLVCSLLPLMLVVSFFVGGCSSQRSRDNTPSLSRLAERIRLLEDKLKATIDRLESVESCDCTKSCHFNDSIHHAIHADGTTWKNGCDICVCSHGVVKCKPRKCPRVTCRKPELVVGECCPVCKRQCLMNGQVLEHGDRLSNVVKDGCYFCECIDGNVKCHHEDRKLCPRLSCPESQQFIMQGECCPTCLETTPDPQTDSPATFDPENLLDPDPDVSQDLDVNPLLDIPSSARITEGLCNGRKCGPNMQCWEGSQCIGVGECEGDDGKCGPNARCVNSQGEYKCECLTGFKGNGRSCDAVPTGTCLTGGVCVLLFLSCMFFSIVNCYYLFRTTKKEELNPS